MGNITYSRVGDYLLPDIKLNEPSPDTVKPLGRYGYLRQRFLQEHRPALYSRLLPSERLYPHLREIDEAATHRVNIIADRVQAEELIGELIYG